LGEVGFVRCAGAAMSFPGEKLVLRLIDTIERSGIGLLRPWQIRRIARAETDAQSEKAYSDFAVEKNLSTLRSLLNDSENLRSTVENNLLKDIPPALLKISMAAHLAEQIRKQENIQNILEKTKTTLEIDASSPPGEFIEMDWFFRWREGAGTISDGLLQEIWGNVLAGEIKNPGTFNLRTLDFLRNLSHAEAKNIEKVASYVVNNTALIFGSGLEIDDTTPPVDFKHFPSRSHLDQLEELGLLNIGSGLGFKFSKSSELSNGNFGWLFRCNLRAVAATSENKSKQIRLGFYKLTSLGQDILRLVNIKPDESHLQELAVYIANEGFDSEIMDFEKVDEEHIRPKNIQRVWSSKVS
jgi:hypothetical protein